MTELTFLKELMLIGQVNQKGAIFVTVGIEFKFLPDVRNGFHDVLIYVYEPKRYYYSKHSRC